MNPVFSVIFFTVTSGLGYGILMLSALMSLLNPEFLSQEGGEESIMISIIIGLVAVSAGLASSALHLSNPKNAWRSFMRFKTAWLSREAVFAVLSYPIALLYGLLIYMDGVSEVYIKIMEFNIILISILTVFSTSMIYACLKTIRAWNTSLVPINYIIMSLMSGGLLTMAVFEYYGIELDILLTITIVMLLMALVGKIIYFYFIGQPSPLTMKSAIGIGFGNIRLLDTGESSDNFLQKEFGYQAESKTLILVRVLSLIFMILIPLLSLLYIEELGLYMSEIVVYISILIINYIGLVLERWLFFAEARHVVNLYYGKKI
jgi:DMSO reductase anchor subunit